MDNSQELQSFLKQEGQKAMISQMVGKLTDQCRDKCIGGTPGSKFSSKESACLSNCAKRFMDMSTLMH
ncbi:Mitochondrial import inner membrane translocase subunit [Musa troglodytarum]|uniref:Mitochondrial import inner membrane translocase subunit n=1 Tax=Musa troglodytarum TaxID=320322 RepID=A0A9E7KNX2_9LILI|nr:Mitochondrial import inner membrane translocase subunit [Musa troglodytarum]